MQLGIVCGTLVASRKDERLEGIRDRLALCIGCGCQTLDSCEIFNPGDIAGRNGSG